MMYVIYIILLSILPYFYLKIIKCIQTCKEAKLVVLFCEVKEQMSRSLRVHIKPEFEQRDVQTPSSLTLSQTHQVTWQLHPAPCPQIISHP